MDTFNRIIGCSHTDAFAVRIRMMWLLCVSLWHLPGAVILLCTLPAMGGGPAFALQIAIAVLYLVAFVIAVGLRAAPPPQAATIAAHIGIAAHLLVVLAAAVVSFVATVGPQLCAVLPALSIVAVLGRVPGAAAIAVLGGGLTIAVAVCNVLRPSPLPYNGTAALQAETVGYTAVVVIFVLTAAWWTQVELTRLLSERDHATNQTVVMKRLTHDVASLMADYDTDAAGEVLKSAKAASTASVLDTLASINVAAADVPMELLESLEELNDKLTRYRPHLPNYILRAAAKKTADSDDEDAGTVSPGGASNQSGQLSALRPHHHDALTSSGLHNSGNASDPHAPPSPHAAMESSMRSGDVSTKSRPSFNDASAVISARGAKKAGPAMSPRSKGINSLQLGVQNRQAVCGPFFFQRADRWRFDEAACHRLIIRVHDLARQTHCSTHMYINDTMFVSFGATARTAQPEVQACRFIAGLQQFMKEQNTGYEFHCALIGGMMTTLYAGDDRQRTFVVTSPSQDKTAAAVPRARALRVPLVDHAVYSVAKFYYVMRAVHVLDGFPTETPAEKLLYEIVRERHHNAQSAEWMYELEEKSDDPNLLVSQACEALCIGDPSRALDVLSSVTDNEVLGAPTVVALQQRCVAAQRGSGAVQAH